MAEMCACEEEWYNNMRLLDIIKTAVLDYINTADRPSSFLFDYFEALKWSSYDPLKAWCSAFRMIKIRNYVEDGTYRYVNGFTKEMTEVIDENTGKPLFNFEEVGRLGDVCN
jgi:hypothetical protein